MKKQTNGRVSESVWTQQSKDCTRPERALSRSSRCMQNLLTNVHDPNVLTWQHYAHSRDHCGKHDRCGTYSIQISNNEHYMIIVVSMTGAVHAIGSSDACLQACQSSVATWPVSQCP